MKILNLKPNTPEWLEERLNHFTASEAPAMMNQSKFMSRNQLLDLKKGWQSNPNSSFKEQLFQDGHDYEDAARRIIEIDILSELLPLIGSRNIQKMELLASFDGINIERKQQWEHKGYNETLAENVRNSRLEPHYYWQLEHQMLVSGFESCMFTVSDGTIDKMVSMHYKSVPERRLEIIAGWKQFESDLENHQLEAKQEATVPTVIKALPVIEWEINGTEISSNIANCLDIIIDRSRLEMDRVLETDQDFTDKDTLNKATKKARADLKDLVQKVQSKFVSYSEFAVVAKDIDIVLQKMQSHGERQVKEAKEAKKNNIIKIGRAKLVAKVMLINNEIEPILLPNLMDCDLDFSSAIKGKRTIESIQNAVDSVNAEFNIKADKAANKVKENLLTLRELAGDYKFLFSDTNQLVTKDNEDLIAVIKTRIADHEESEKEKAEELRKKIQLKEEAKAKAKKKIDDEQKAKELAEQEAARKLEDEQKPSINEPKQEMTEQKETEIEQGLPFVDQKAPRETKEQYDGNGTLVDENGNRSVFDDVDIMPDDETPFAIEDGENIIEMRKVYSTQLKADIIIILNEYNISESFGQRLSEVLKKHGLI